MSPSRVEDSSSESEARFVPQDDDEEMLWEVVEIVAETKSQYKVKWAGLDPKTGKPWAPSWVAKKDCTDALVKTWRESKAQKRRKSAGASSSTTSKGAKPANGHAQKAKKTVLSVPLSKVGPPRHIKPKKPQKTPVQKIAHDHSHLPTDPPPYWEDNPFTQESTPAEPESTTDAFPEDVYESTDHHTADQNNLSIQSSIIADNSLSRIKSQMKGKTPVPSIKSGILETGSRSVSIVPHEDANLAEQEDTFHSSRSKQLEDMHDSALITEDLFICRYVSKDVACHALFSTPQEVQLHAFSIHYASKAHFYY